MTELRLDGRTAIVTGAGGDPSLGRAYALLLAQRGANVVVNDIGEAPGGPNYSAPASAEAVAQEIRAQGGKAIADCNSVATEDGARAIVQTAVDAFGGVDILVNNAVFSAVARFDELTSQDIRRHIDVNLMGPIWTCRAAWPHMRAQGYGRIINISSPAFVGLIGAAAYSVTKGGVFSLTRSLAAEGAPFGIRVNTVSPGGFSRLVAALWSDTSDMYRLVKEQLPPELVAPVVVYLAHQDCAVSGECIEAAGGTFRRIYVAQTTGVTDRALTVEKVAERWAEAMAGAHSSALGFAGGDVTEGAKPYLPSIQAATVAAATTPDAPPPGAA
jgi:NAD(P)-dependent dehydrogenase (short-subunit alcohol dehydrogenase family)